MRYKLAILMIFGSLVLWSGCQTEATTPNEPTTPLPDTIAPVAIVLPLEDEQLSLQFKLAYKAHDENSGVASVEIFVRTPNQTLTSLGYHNQSPVTYLASEDGPHEFYAVAVDSAGNRQATPQFAQAATMVPVPIIITDRRGEDFDITNAVLRYFMSENGWGHGLGRNTIRPINDPQFWLPGQIGYPAPNLMTDVLAIEINGEARAYPVGNISNREVVNDVVGGVHLSATY